MRRRVSTPLVHSQLFFLCVLGCGPSVAAKNQPDLLNISSLLECASTAHSASDVLQSYKNIALPQLPLPNEWFNSDKSPSLHAASLDIALHALTSASTRFPELADEVEQIVLQWGYCEVLLDNTFYDFVSTDGQMQRLIAHSSSPIDWEGFRAVGFLGDHQDRFVIDAYKHDDAPFVFYEVDYSRMFRGQCLPHPQTSKLFFDSDTYFPWRVVQDGYKPNGEYPYEWQAGCTSNEPELVKQAEEILSATNDSDAAVESEPSSESDPDVGVQSDVEDVLSEVKPAAKAEPALAVKGKEASEPEAAALEDDSERVPEVGSEGEPEANSNSEPAADTQNEPQSDSLGQIELITPDQATELTEGASATQSAQKAVMAAALVAESDSFATSEQLREAAEVAGISAFAGVSHTLSPANTIGPFFKDETNGTATVFVDENNQTYRAEPSDEIGANSGVFELDTPIRHELSQDERDLLIATRLIGYRYELVAKHKSMSNVATGPGYVYFRMALRPELVNDGVPDYIAAKKSTGQLVDGIADYIDPKRLQPDEFVPAIHRKALIASASELGQHWVDEVRNKTLGYRRPRLGVVGDRKRSAPVISKQVEPSVLTAVTTVPVIVGEGGAAPDVVFGSEPEPNEEISKPPQIRTKKKKKYHGLSGFVTLGNRSIDADGFSITTGATYKPIRDSYWFARSSWNYRFDDEEFRYTYGIGYDDWHPGTWAFQLNHWGPLLPGDYLDIDNAVASITYKFNKNKFMTKNRVSSSVTLSQKIAGEPLLSWSNSWNPKSKWFIRSTISQPLKGGDLSWSYGFGYANYSPFTFSFEYNNWGYNKAFEYNFKDNANLSMTYRWRY